MFQASFTGFADSDHCILAAVELKPHLNRSRTKKLTNCTLARAFIHHFTVFFIIRNEIFSSKQKRVCLEQNAKNRFERPSIPEIRHSLLVATHWEWMQDVCLVARFSKTSSPGYGPYSHETTQHKTLQSVNKTPLPCNRKEWNNQLSFLPCFPSVNQSHSVHRGLSPYFSLPQVVAKPVLHFVVWHVSMPWDLSLCLVGNGVEI